MAQDIHETLDLENPKNIDGILKSLEGKPSTKQTYNLRTTNCNLLRSKFAQLEVIDICQAVHPKPSKQKVAVFLDNWPSKTRLDGWLPKTVAGKQDGPGPLIYGPPRAPPPNSQTCTFLYIVAHIWKTGSYFFPLLYIYLLCDEVLLPWNFCSPVFDIRAPQNPPPPPKYEKKYYFCSYFGFKLKNFLSDCLLIWYVHRYGWEDSWKAR